jgi:hypothetical protein
MDQVVAQALTTYRRHIEDLDRDALTDLSGIDAVAAE